MITMNENDNAIHANKRVILIKLLVKINEGIRGRINEKFGGPTFLLLFQGKLDFPPLKTRLRPSLERYGFRHFCD